jgi:hypothetical protein
MIEMHDRPLVKHPPPLVGHPPTEARRVFTLTVRNEPNVNAIRSLRRALKTMWRRDGLKCISISEIPETSKTPKGS